MSKANYNKSLPVMPVMDLPEIYSTHTSTHKASSPVKPYKFKYISDDLDNWKIAFSEQNDNSALNKLKSIEDLLEMAVPLDAPNTDLLISISKTEAFKLRQLVAKSLLKYINKLKTEGYEITLFDINDSISIERQNKMAIFIQGLLAENQVIERVDISSDKPKFKISNQFNDKFLKNIEQNSDIISNKMHYHGFFTEGRTLVRTEELLSNYKKRNTTNYLPSLKKSKLFDVISYDSAREWVKVFISSQSKDKSEDQREIPRKKDYEASQNKMFVHINQYLTSGKVSIGNFYSKHLPGLGKYLGYRYMDEKNKKAAFETLGQLLTLAEIIKLSTPEKTFMDKLFNGDKFNKLQQQLERAFYNCFSNKPDSDNIFSMKRTKNRYFEREFNGNTVITHEASNIIYDKSFRNNIATQIKDKLKGKKIFEQSEIDKIVNESVNNVLNIELKSQNKLEEEYFSTKNNPKLVDSYLSEEVEKRKQELSRTYTRCSQKQQAPIIFRPFAERLVCSGGQKFSR